MSDVSREEFDRLAGRVDRNERTLDATVSMIAAEVVGLRTAMDEQFHTVITMIGNEATLTDQRFDRVDTRLESLDAKLDQSIAVVNTRFDHSDAEINAKLDRIIGALGGD
ncbi:MAG: hypothetical protein QM733_07790 [Ilumatobacteraceae bacterium]